MMSLKDINAIFKQAYDPEWPYPHTHLYTKEVIQDIVEPIFIDDKDREYHDKCPDRWQGEVKKIGEHKFMVCSVCEKTIDTVKRLEALWKGITKIT